MKYTYLTKTQKRALKDLKIESTYFGPGYSYKYITGQALVNKGLAKVSETGTCLGSDRRKENSYMKAEITDKGLKHLVR